MQTQIKPQTAEPIAPGTLTMLLTDVEGSTKLWEEHPDAMRRPIQRHHELAHQAIERYGGYRPPDQGEGDSVFAVFAEAPSAVACALDFQRSLAAEPWPDQVVLRVRIALHTGAIDLRDGRNYAGLALNRCARLRAIAHGGQVILSEATRALTAPDLPVGVSLQDLGVHRLTDLSLPERVFQLCHPDLPAAFPPLRSLDARPHNLPLQLTRFVGRARELDEVRSTLRSARLVTLTGTGGSGKTRLALRVAADLLEEHSDGTWFVELAGTEDPNLVPRVVSSTIGLREQQGRHLLDMLVDHLATKATLLVLDNCEHLLEACAALADRLLRACAGLTILATSREPLGITGEVVRRVPPLSVPAAALAPGAAAAAAFEAVQLFVDRAVAAEPRFSLADANAAAIVAICRRLEGIPLALELAAARLQGLTIEQIRDRLQDRFRLLTGGSRTARPRQQTLRATVDWSHDLLSEPERMLLRRLSVFAGGFSLEAAEQVCGDRLVSPEDVLNLLTRLVGRSLVLFEAGPAGGRYRLLETIREYALERLRQGREESELRRRHLQYCIGFAETAEPALRGPDQKAWLERLHVELDNFRAAFGWSLRQQAPGSAIRLASALLEFWVVRADWSEGLEWVERALDRPGEVDPAIRMKALCAAAELADVLSDFPRSTARYEVSLEIARALTQLAEVALLGGKVSEARSLFEETLPIWEEIGHKTGLLDSLRGLGDVARQEGDIQRAESFLQRSLEVCRAIGSLEREARALQSLGAVAMARGDRDGAEFLHCEALTLLHRMEHLDGIAASLRALGAVAAAEGRLDRAARLLGASEALRERVGGTVPPGNRGELERVVARVRSGLGTEAFRQAWEVGRQCTVEAAVGLALEAAPASGKDGGAQKEALEGPPVL